MFRSAALSLLVIALPAAAACCALRKADDLPLATEVAWQPLREHVRALTLALERRGQALPAETIQALRKLLDSEPDDPEAASSQVQKLLDPFSLIGVSINPESRVKSARGPAEARLVRGRERLVLVKVLNEGGVRSPLRVLGPHLLGDRERGADAWLDARIAEDGPLRAKLSGERVQYFLLVLKAGETGKREALFRFDVGQGTQDLGFRAEVPILFTIADR
jgi:hypothetical protein